VSTSTNSFFLKDQEKANGGMDKAAVVSERLVKKSLLLIECIVGIGREVQIKEQTTILTKRQ
jgi:hypothetical protein